MTPLLSHSDSRSAGGRFRILIAKPGLDGHDRGAKYVANILRDAGFEVIYTGIRRTPEQIVRAALQEDVDAIGISLLSGAHLTLVARLTALLTVHGAERLPIFVGGVIPESDIPELQALGVCGVFGPGTPARTLVESLTTHLTNCRHERNS
jgi:methylmalonyl-CoA mutase C-terminal domain/subunit